MYAWKLRREWEILLNRRERCFLEWTASSRHDLTFAGARLNLQWALLTLQFKEQEIRTVIGDEALDAWTAEVSPPTVGLAVDPTLWADLSAAEAWA
jgi:hypothetical protein